MTIKALDAAAAYGRAIKASDAASSLGAAEAPAGADFGGMVQTMVSDTATALRGAENASAKQVAGKGDMIDVVTAIGAAESALHTVVAVRDRVIGAYNDIMRMQI
ncbi:flagellar hook-basal body complex protein FliE [Sphingomonas sp. AP4-R1]|uniref:flagellar hook-basal body complex protein FliE n=1 Tax=Sphingomonas sp. AP4-R1 TaxID=2735134 RepID=UPI00149372DF|nr:flagellar hook-basal body complex protein FliE [Sphingomonas sp. AP4-R1]QJU57415.1 flagellar hook-basal body complex protein FliE [Sphingomonas sp. AP4-R1]